MARTKEAERIALAEIRQQALLELGIPDARTYHNFLLTRTVAANAIGVTLAQLRTLCEPVERKSFYGTIADLYDPCDVLSATGDPQLRDEWLSGKAERERVVKDWKRERERERKRSIKEDRLAHEKQRKLEARQAKRLARITPRALLRATFTVNREAKRLRDKARYSADRYQLRSRIRELYDLKDRAITFAYRRGHIQVVGAHGPLCLYSGLVGKKQYRFHSLLWPADATPTLMSEDAIVVAAKPREPQEMSLESAVRQLSILPQDILGFVRKYFPLRHEWWA